jgi:hypothetical protein
MNKPILVAVILSLAGTAGAQPPPGMEEPQQCPDFIRGTKLVVKNIEDGVAFSFTTPTRTQVSPLRIALHDMAAIFDAHADRRMANVDEPEIHVEVKNIASGAVVRVTAAENTVVPLLREQAKEVKRQWQASTCVSGERHAGDMMQI